MRPHFDLRKKGGDHQVQKMQTEVLAHQVILKLLEDTQHAQTNCPRRVVLLEAIEERFCEEGEHRAASIVNSALLLPHEQRHVVQKPLFLGPHAHPNQAQDKRHVLAAQHISLQLGIQAVQTPSTHHTRRSTPSSAPRTPTFRAEGGDSPARRTRCRSEESR